MKRWLFLIFALAAVKLGLALPVGNPADASLLPEQLFPGASLRFDFSLPCAKPCEAISFRLGYYGDFVFNRHLKKDEEGTKEGLTDTDLCTNAGFAALNVCDRIDLFGTLGATRMCMEANGRVFLQDTLVSDSRINITTETDYSWSVGVRGTIIELGCTTIGGEFQYFYTRPEVTRIDILGLNNGSLYPDENVSYKYKEWQFGIGMAHRIYMAVPYIAVKYAKAKAGANHPVFNNFPFTGQTVRLFDLKNARKVGYAVGITFTNCGNKSLTAEGRWGDERALYINGQVHF